MATKKQKRVAALARREAFLEEERLRGKKALEESRKAQIEQDILISNELDDCDRKGRRALAAFIIANLHS